MVKIQTVLRVVVSAFLTLLLLEASINYSSGEIAVQSVSGQRSQSLKETFAAANFTWGSPIFIRIFKQSRELELWVERDNTFTLFKVYPICALDTRLGPKIKRGDQRSPEGFYKIGKSQLNPNSDYHLALNVGYPNAYDRAHHRTGSALMIHGDCVTAGCFAMDQQIDEIYALTEAATRGGREVSVHIFPFHMTEEAMKLHESSEWYPFWQNLKSGYDFFEKSKALPTIAVKQKRYLVSL